MRSPEMSPFLDKQETLDKDLGLMTFAEYSKIDHLRPYEYRLQAGDKVIEYVGLGHRHDPEDPAFKLLEDKFSETNPDIVLVEGLPNIKGQDIQQQVKRFMENKSRSEIIGEMGEVGYSLYLAAKQGVEIESPEPDFKDEIQHQTELGFSPEAIFATYLARQLISYQRVRPKPDINQYLNKYIQTFKEASNWLEFEYTPENFKKIGQELWGQDFNLEDADFFRKVEDPTPWEDLKDQQSVTNEIARQSSYFRDAFVVNRIRELLKHKNKVFIVFGASHAVMQEPALRKIMAFYE